MDEILAHPMFQAGFGPFLAAFAFASVLRRSRFAGMALIVAFTVVIGLTIGYAFDALTGVRKLVIVCWGCAALVLVLPARIDARPAKTRTAVAIGAGVAGLWVVSRILAQQSSLAQMLLFGAALVAYLALLMESSLRCARDSRAAAAASLVQGVTTGALGVLSASALLAEIGMAVAAGAAALLLVQLLFRARAISGWRVAMFSAVSLGLVNALAVFTGSLPWYCLIPTLAIPWATCWACTPRRSLSTLHSSS